jgi:2,3-bisphosphoglycerate-independent phosphoglycerate mutase
MNSPIKPVALVILDGFGFSKQVHGNAVANANMPFLKSSLQNNSTLLHASGQAVGLPKGYDGNSEVGHRTIGSGQITETILTKFNNSIKNETISSNPVLISSLKALSPENKLHLIILLSDAGVHSHHNHLYSIMEIAFKQNIKIVVHPILDGRDAPPRSAIKYLKILNNVCAKTGATIGSMHGRFFAMDRDNNWGRIEKSFNVLTSAKKIIETTWQDAINLSYQSGISDEFIEPIRLSNEGKISSGDGIFFLNFRSDRALQLSKAFIQKEFTEFNRDISPEDLKFFVTSASYNGLNNHVLFERDYPSTSLLDEITEQTGKKVVCIAETEKFAHVTYFFRESKIKKNDLISSILVPSIKAKSYENSPEMSAKKITETVINLISSEDAIFYLINYANPDMVGHSANMPSTIAACEALDIELKNLYLEIVEKRNGTLFVTSDHGNAEELLTGSVAKTSHTQNPVPFLILTKKEPATSALDPEKITFGLSNVASTILEQMKLKTPCKMEGNIIFIH